MNLTKNGKTDIENKAIVTKGEEEEGYVGNMGLIDAHDHIQNRHIDK